MNKSASFLFMARGSSHICYFKQFAKDSRLSVAVVKINRIWLKLGYLRFWSDASKVNTETLLKPHFLKKARKYPSLSKTPLWALYIAFIRGFVRLDIIKFMGIISDNSPQVVGVWNGQKLPSSAIVLAAKALNKEVVYFENGLLPDTTTCDWSGVNCMNSLPRDASFYRQFDYDRPLPTHLIARTSANAKAKGLDIDALPKRFIFVPFQVETDSQIITNSTWIRSMGQLYHHLANALDMIDDPDLHLVIKEHPSEDRRHDALHHKHPRMVFANQCKTQDLIENSQAVLTINSTVGLESLLLDKPVIVLGSACYDVAGMCKKVTDENMLVAALSNPGLCYGEHSVRRGFLNFLYEHYVIPTSWSQADAKHVEALSARLLKEDTFNQLIKSQKTLSHNRSSSTFSTESAYIFNSNVGQKARLLPTK